MDYTLDVSQLCQPGRYSDEATGDIDFDQITSMDITNHWLNNGTKVVRLNR